MNTIENESNWKGQPCACLRTQTHQLNRLKAGLQTHGSWRAVLAAVLLAGLAPTRLAADVPMMLHYQGNVQMSGTNYHGAGYFKFALVDAAGTTTYWSNDGSSTGGSEPSAAITIPVDDGYYSVVLGGTNLTAMTNVPYEVFYQNERVWLRIWFSHNAATYQHLEPDQRIAAVGYAMVAQTVVEGAISTEALADESITTDKLKQGSVTSEILANQIDLGSPATISGMIISPGATGELQVYPGGLNTNSSITLKGTDGSVTANGVINSRTGFNVTKESGSSIPGLPDLTKAALTTDDNGGSLVLYRDDNHTGAELYGNHGKVILHQDNHQVGVELLGDVIGGGGGPAILLNTVDGRTGVYVDGDHGGAGGLWVYGTNGTPVIELEGNDGGEGKITTQVLEIKGGSDLSEQFNVCPGVGTVEPGMIVCIDTERPGELRVSDRPYDATVAGVVSGAGGVKPGMLMGQQGTVANGKHPVALTGRVYCRVDASYGSIKPGDLITTSGTPGHGMRADPARAAGAIIGKAMTPLADGRGLVLVLVSLQ
jgi:hypothetical protein